MSHQQTMIDYDVSQIKTSWKHMSQAAVTKFAIWNHIQRWPFNIFLTFWKGAMYIHEVLNDLMNYPLSTVEENIQLPEVQAGCDPRLKHKMLTNAHHKE